MITLITGAPGAGKSAALVSLLQQLAKDRTIYAHGIPDLKVPHQTLDKPNDWHTDVPDGSIIVIDEVQNVWRPKGPGQGIPADIQALETHRHRGIDFYIVTQNPRLLHTNVRSLVGRHIHLRDVGFLGRYWYEWPECAENCLASWKQAPLKKRYKLPKAIFGQYKSASVHVKPVRSFPWMLVVAVVALAATVALGLFVANNIKSKVDGSKPQINQADKAKPLTPVPSPVAAPAEHQEPPQLAAPDAPKPYDPTIFYPQNPRVPESAPAYDHLRVVVAMPRVAGGICGSKGCKCYTEQGNPVAMSSNDCREVIEANTFDPYRVAQRSPERPPAPLPEPAPVYHPPGVLSMPAPATSVTPTPSHAPPVAANPVPPPLRSTIARSSA